MAPEHKHLNARGQGEYNYNYKHDILFFKIKNREYQKSLDFEDMMIDIDKEGFPTGVQLFDASKTFKLNKLTLKNVKKWEFHITSEHNILTLHLTFMMVRRNKQIIERGENIIRESSSPLQNTRVLCTVPPPENL